jgi:1,4-dihydroxy-2-naphthoate octaprenyltransferase
MEEPQAVATRYAQRRALWKAAIKWPMYSVAVMPVLLAAGWQLGFQGILRWDQLFGFLLAAILLLLWENLSNDLFDADTGVDAVGKPHSVVNLTGRRDRIAWLSSAALLFGLSLMAWLAWRSHPAVLLLVLLCCGLGYVYQGPPFRLGYQGLGEPLCWLAFGPVATSAALLVLAPAGSGEVPWQAALVLGAGPALATSLVLFCSHFHQVEEDAAHGKRSPVVRLGTGSGRGVDSLVRGFHPRVGVVAGGVRYLAAHSPAQRCGTAGWLGLDSFGAALSRSARAHQWQQILGLAISGLEWAWPCPWLSSRTVVAVGMTLQLLVRPFSFSLLQPLRTATGVLLERRGWLLRFCDGDSGALGWGEVAPLRSEQWLHCQTLLEDLPQEMRP